MFTLLEPASIPIFVLAILIALSFHEAAHAFAADRLGDPTARNLGRLTLNPIAHLDLLGSILFIFAGFGWGKPVPVNSRYFKHPKRDTAIVAAAGPFSNFCLALLCVAGMLIIFGGMPWSIDSLLSPSNTFPIGERFLLQFLGGSLYLNLGLMAFNLLPIAPLDGSNVLRLFIPYTLEDRYEEVMRIGPYILLFLLIAERMFGFGILSTWITTLTQIALAIIAVITSPLV